MQCVMLAFPGHTHLIFGTNLQLGINQKIYWARYLISSVSPPVASVVVRFKAMVLMLLIHCLLLIPKFVGFCDWSLFCYVVLSVLSSFAFILLG